MSSNKLNIYICKSFKDRFLGFMFRKNLDKILCFPKCNSIHTFFMKKPIQVIITNNENIVLFNKIIKPWKIILPIKKGKYTYEIPLNSLIEIKIGEKINL